MRRALGHAAGGHDSQPWQVRRAHDLVHRVRAGDVIGEPDARRGRVEAQAEANGALRIGVDEQRLVSAAGERGREVYRRRRLAHAAFLTDDGENLVPRYCSGSPETASLLRRLTSVSSAWRTQRSASGPDGGFGRKASRCFSAPGRSPRLSRRNARP